MRGEISITVQIPGEPPATYTFYETPIHLGRSTRCHLAIRHTAIPRELCTLWLMDDGKQVRVEERPGLTNDILINGRRLSGGITAAAIDLAVGPVQCHINAGRPQTPDSENSLWKKFHPKLLAQIAGILFLIGISLFCWYSGHRMAPRISPEDFPQSLTMPDLTEPIDKKGNLVAQAELLISRAKELEQRPRQTISNRRKTISLLLQGAEILSSDAPTQARQYRQQADQMYSELQMEYRKELMLLFLHLRNGAAEQVKTSAENLLRYLEGTPCDKTEWLQTLLHRGP